MSSFFKDLGGAYTGDLSSQTPEGNKRQPTTVFPGHVLDICLDETHWLYETPRDIGKIRFRDILVEVNIDESKLNKVAYPLDRSINRYPYPGEEVIIFKALGESTSPNTTVLSSLFFYSFVVSAMQNITFNANPFIGTDSNSIDGKSLSTPYDEAKKRLQNKIKNPDAVTDINNKPKVFKQLKPYEGDFILQGRFGNSIRLTSTLSKADNKWKDSGVSGDGLLIMRVDRDLVNNESQMLTQEDINVDDASLYMCTSQKIDLTLACSKSMRSWASTYDIPAHGSAEAANTFTKSVSTSGLWQKTGK